MTYIIIREDELYHHGIKGMKWGVRNEKKKQAKAEYKARIKELRKAHSDLSKANNDYGNYLRGDSIVSRNYKKGIAQAKTDLKDKKINKKQFRERKRALRDERLADSDRAAQAAAIGHYWVTKAEREAKAKYIAQIKGEDSKAYRKAVELVNRNFESYDNYTVTLTPEGKYKLTHYTYVYM